MNITLVNNLLRKAATRILCGWGQGFMSRNGKVCALGALASCRWVPAGRDPFTDQRIRLAAVRMQAAYVGYPPPEMDDYSLSFGLFASHAMNWVMHHNDGRNPETGAVEMAVLMLRAAGDVVQDDGSMFLPGYELERDQYKLDWDTFVDRDVRIMEMVT